MILLLDNYDSFTYNIAHALGRLGAEIRVVRSDAITVEEIKSDPPQALVISPGPGRPEEAGICLGAIERLAGRVPILGVCLGHQCIGQVFGARVVRAGRLVHGKTSAVLHDGRTIYEGLRNPFSACRYHSLIVPEETVPKELEVSAYTRSGEVMGLRSEKLMIEGVQFHPESIATDQGQELFRNFLAHYLGLRRAA